MKRIVIMLVVACLLGSCNSSINNQDDSQKRGSSGKTLEMLVVADPNVYCGDTKALVDSLFGRPQECLPTPESMFSIVNIPVSSYKNTDMFLMVKNILKIYLLNSLKDGGLQQDLDMIFVELNYLVLSSLSR